MNRRGFFARLLALPAAPAALRALAAEEVGHWEATEACLADDPYSIPCFIDYARLAVTEPRHGSWDAQQFTYQP